MKQDARFYSFTLGVRATPEQAEYWKEAFLKLIKDGVDAPYISFSFSSQEEKDDEEDE